jgi:hypothetical protein
MASSAKNSSNCGNYGSGLGGGGGGPICGIELLLVQKGHKLM